MSKFYIAYGSNLNEGQMKHRCPQAKKICAGMLADYKLVFRRGYLTIEPEAGGRVPVGIWQITEKDEKALDRYEGYPSFYEKENLQVVCLGAQMVEAVEAMAYIMREGFPLQAPSGFYLATVLHGYNDFGFGHEESGGLMEAYNYAKSFEESLAAIREAVAAIRKQVNLIDDGDKQKLIGANMRAGEEHDGQA